jgi:hypothetical protein
VSACDVEPGLDSRSSGLVVMLRVVRRVDKGEWSMKGPVTGIEVYTGWVGYITLPVAGSCYPKAQERRRSGGHKQARRCDPISGGSVGVGGAK